MISIPMRDVGQTIRRSIQAFYSGVHSRRSSVETLAQGHAVELRALKVVAERLRNNVEL
jgi:hypothetical protein